ncbi:hypothetical protein I79_006572 [Cricetulus griseus]|uniref:Uncharacterized protein n=1 Tax=Cricetulus griseus TaxID=10029 RepID=G3H874_CRIGR|nr:hypothetical protein I79_006572 [Cricetulus griseus]
MTRGDDVSFTSWVCTQVCLKADCFRWGLGQLETSGEDYHSLQEFGTGLFGAFSLLESL